MTAASTTPSVAVDALIQSEGHVAATGSAGSVHIAIAPVDDQSQISIGGYRQSFMAGDRLTLTTIARGPDCPGALHDDTGGLTAASTQVLMRPYPWDNTFEDLSMLKFAVIARAGLTWADTCADRSAIVVPLHWTVPAALAELTVSDHGRRYGAHGSVVDRDGRPLRYTVARDDLLNSVAARFGLTPDELLWLTPSRSHGQEGQLYAGEELNLAPAYRGLYT